MPREQQGETGQDKACCSNMSTIVSHRLHESGLLVFAIPVSVLVLKPPQNLFVLKDQVTRELYHYATFLISAKMVS